MENIDIVYRLSITDPIYTFEDFAFEIKNALEPAFSEMERKVSNEHILSSGIYLNGGLEEKTSLFVNQLLFSVAPAFTLKSYNLSDEDLEKYLSTIKDVQWESEYKERSLFYKTTTNKMLT